MKENEETLEERLRREVLALDKPIKRIATEAGVAQPSLHWFTKDGRSLSLKAAHKLMVYLGLEVVRKN